MVATESSCWLLKEVFWYFAWTALVARQEMLKASERLSFVRMIQAQ